MVTSAMSSIGDSLRGLVSSISGSTPPSATPIVASASAKESAWYEDAWSYLESGYNTVFGGGGATGCLSEGEMVTDVDGGVPADQPDPPDGGEVTDSGATIIDGNVYLPIDDAGPILPDDVWFPVSGEGSFFVATPNIPFGGPDTLMEGSGLQNMTLYVHIGTDSTLISEPVMPAEGCFQGLINTTPADDFGACDEAGYEEFAVCPSNPNNGIPVYLLKYTLTGYRDGDIIGVQQNEYSTIEDLYADPASGQLLGAFCDDSQIGISIPAEWYNDGALSVQVEFTLAAMAQGDENAAYKTYVGVRVDE